MVPDTSSSDGLSVADDSDDAGEGNSAELFAAQIDQLSVYFKGGTQFLRNSEALEDFKEGLMDFRVALENSLQNQLLQTKETPGELDQAELKTNWNFGFLWRTVIEKARKTFRPSVKSGLRRVEWICVSVQFCLSEGLLR